MQRAKSTQTTTLLRILCLYLLLVVGVGHVVAQTQLTNLPSMYINTFTGRDITSKTTYVYARMNYIDNDDVRQYDTLEIRGRGNSTWGLSKKPYRIKFLSSEKFLGQGYAKAKSWTLIANAADKTMLRNALTAELGDFLGLQFNAAARFVDLTLNDRYAGTYQISDQIQVRPHRVNIVEQDEVLAANADITGGYLMEVDGFREGNCFSTSRAGVPVRVHSPDETVIVSSQNNYIRDYVNTFETRLFSTSFKDAKEGYRPMVDSVSLAQWYISTELSTNPDGMYSTYFYKEQKDSLLYWGPLWDYDIAYNNCNRLGDLTKKLITEVGFGATKSWTNRMWLDPWFGQLICREWEEAVSRGVESHLLLKVDSMARRLEDSQKLNYQRWSINSKMYHDELVIFDTYQEYIEFLKNFIQNRIAYLGDAFLAKRVEPDHTPEPEPEPEPEPTPDFELIEGFYYRIMGARTGNNIDLTDGEGSESSPVGTWQPLSERTTQDWAIYSYDKYYQLINRESGMALNDPAEIGIYSSSLNQAHPDSTDLRQLWSFQPQGTEGYYNLINAYTNQVANNAGGSATNGTNILSYTNDADRNASSLNRLWAFTVTPEPVPNEIEDVEYALLLSLEGKRIRFVSPQPEALSFIAQVHSLNGMKVGQMSVSEEFSLEFLPRGTYIVSWNYRGKNYSKKFNL